MTKKHLIDGVTLDGTRLTADGYLVAEAFAVRTGIQIYTGDEVDPTGELGLKDKPTVRVYRSEDEVRSPESLRSFSHAPITVGHPPGGVTSDSWKELAVGEVSTEATWQDNKIKLPLIIKDKAAITNVTNGTRELSAGYVCELVAEDGKTEDGQQYDAVQKNIRINHLAIVPRGRAGHECRIGDADNWGASPSEKEVKMTTKHIALGDSTAEVVAGDADKVTAYINTMRDSHKATVDSLNKDLATKDAKIAELEGQKLTDAQIDERVVARTKLLSDAKLIAPNAKFEGLSDNEIRKTAVRAVDPTFTNDSEAYIAAMFDIQCKKALEDADKKAKADPAMNAHTQQKTIADSKDDVYGFDAREREMMDAWKTKE